VYFLWGKDWIFKHYLKYNCCDSEYYPPSCLFLLKTQRFGDWILSLSSAADDGVIFRRLECVSAFSCCCCWRRDTIQSLKRYVLSDNKKKNRTVVNVQKHNDSVNTPPSQTLDLIVSDNFPSKRITLFLHNSCRCLSTSSAILITASWIPACKPLPLLWFVMDLVPLSCCFSWKSLLFWSCPFVESHSLINLCM
jgi:hypothetical protein